jgi:catechol 2,3-dioxygenase-like lactoylglutathione lyase family enzyme
LCGFFPNNQTTPQTYLLEEGLVELPLFDAQIVFVPTGDLAASTYFYETVLRLPLALDQGGIRIYQAAGQGYLGLCQSETPLAADDRLILTFVSEQVDEWYAHLQSCGVTTDGPPRENPRYRIYHFFARDPDGYRVEIQRFLHPFPNW